jgi:hypothetical protein
LLTIKELAPMPKPVTALDSLRPEIENDLNILLDDVVFEAADLKDLPVNPLKLTAKALGEECSGSLL